MRALLLLLLLLPGLAGAVEPRERLPDPAMEARAREVSRTLRCLVCQNESIDDSNADLARDIRVLLRERLSSGDSNDQARQFIVDRYGDFVLLKPPLKGATLLLWFGPALVLLVSGIGVVLWLRRRPQAAVLPAPLNEAERARLARLLQEPEA
ncbi:Cytochrome c-type biogenesis protein CcmH [Rhodovastum atsumiense]|uniref:Cytochrome c-type biogenesis protein n=1 Tax=Rhodovastum atsumiense TaxID=504468 RepID=A0A5M6IT64_9PROT|nr:cytochrome c-type biogenesis protein [Rhodovastum atsumiense]KAA5611017.1 cytochrome c-type biogenesis protein CcmH [Rhodovastum atsumiense]CAH2600199.1 Cytochrome c-type biogenesis protein CcmH [Rhodovastum atsumiense]